jgi:2-polyprenyl-3-methyl-5-hydroxy-6-metoxy-1,4-benzoquinol methylase
MHLFAMTAKAQQFWDEHAAQFDANEKDFEAQTREILAKTKKYLDANDTVLDFGCATGTKTLDLAPSVKKIHGLDFSTEMIKEAVKKRDASHQTNCSFTQGTIYTEDLQPASFDKIISYSVLHLLEDSEETIRRIHALLKPGGLFISATACFREKKSFRKWLEVRNILQQIKRGTFPLHLNLFKAADVEKMMVDQNFQVVESEKIFTGITAVFIVAGM